MKNAFDDEDIVINDSPFAEAVARSVQVTAEVIALLAQVPSWRLLDKRLRRKAQELRECRRRLDHAIWLRKRERQSTPLARQLRACIRHELQQRGES